MEQIINSIPLTRTSVVLDSIDLMGQAELGSSREMMVDQLQSPRCEDGFQTYYFIQPHSKVEYYLCRDREGEDFSLYAKLDEPNRCFNIYRHKPSEPNFRADLPDFKLCFDTEHKKWTASVYHNSFVCDKCMYSKRERSYSISSSISTSDVSGTLPVAVTPLLELHQQVEKVPTGQHWFYLDCRGKSAEFGEGLVECPECCDSPRRSHVKQNLHVHSNPPTIKNGELKVKFVTNGRDIIPSARNVQCSSSKHDGGIVFQFVKVGDGIYNIDFKSPLSPIQALFIATSTHYWV
jgi:hypothetical protein